MGLFARDTCAVVLKLDCARADDPHPVPLGEVLHEVFGRDLRKHSIQVDLDPEAVAPAPERGLPGIDYSRRLA